MAKQPRTEPKGDNRAHSRIQRPWGIRVMLIPQTEPQTVWVMQRPSVSSLLSSLSLRLNGTSATR